MTASRTERDIDGVESDWLEKRMVSFDVLQLQSEAGIEEGGGNFLPSFLGMVVGFPSAHYHRT